MAKYPSPRLTSGDAPQTGSRARQSAHTWPAGGYEHNPPCKAAAPTGPKSGPSLASMRRLYHSGLHGISRPKPTRLKVSPA